MANVNTSRRPEQGFTLVELAIVMVIIGLLIGEILKGQELIANAKVTATATQLKSTDAALNTFYDKYSAYSGDMVSPVTKLPNCITPPCNEIGDSDGKIQGHAGGPIRPPVAGQEAYRAFTQLAAADLITGITPSKGAAFGGVFPDVKAGGGMWMSYVPTVISRRTMRLEAGKHYAALAGAITSPGADEGVLTATMAAQLDRKLDDGFPLREHFRLMATARAAPFARR